MDDLLRLRDIDSLSVSPDGQSYAIQLRQAEANTNSYRLRWLVGSLSGAPLRNVGDGGEVRLRASDIGMIGGELVGSKAQWSPDSRAIAYTVYRNGEVQLWLNRLDENPAQQLTHNSSNVREFAWSRDGTGLYFSIDNLERAVVRTDQHTARRQGIPLRRLGSFYSAVFDATPLPTLATAERLWVVDRESGAESPLPPDLDVAAREHISAANSWRGRNTLIVGARGFSNFGASAEISANGARAWLTPVDADGGPTLRLRLVAARGPTEAPIECNHDACTTSQFQRIWWSSTSEEVIFWRKQGLNGTNEDGFYAWDPHSGALRLLHATRGDRFNFCEMARDRLVCVRETPTVPNAVVSLSLTSGTIDSIANVNPEFRNIQLGRVEYFEWSAPDVAGHGYPTRLWGRIIYPPNFDPTQHYPAIIAPYAATGFPRGDLGDEQPLFVYAAQGFVVINSQFVGAPPLSTEAETSLRNYSQTLGFPRLTALMLSTLAALDEVESRGFIDPTRVGIGGLSTGAFVPMYMMQNYDRLSAVSLSGPGWSQFGEIYTGFRPELDRSYWPEDAQYWANLDLADHVSQIEAPLLFQVADRELFGILRLQRRLRQANVPLDAYVFPNEFHQKWQPAHRRAIYARNVDWFRFWLKDIEDLDPAKVEQYARWRELRAMQCHNPRSLRDYCDVVSTQAPIAH